MKDARRVMDILSHKVIIDITNKNKLEKFSDLEETKNNENKHAGKHEELKEFSRKGEQYTLKNLQPRANTTAQC